VVDAFVDLAEGRELREVATAPMSDASIGEVLEARPPRHKPSEIRGDLAAVNMRGARLRELLKVPVREALDHRSRQGRDTDSPTSVAAARRNLAQRLKRTASRNDRVGPVNQSGSDHSMRLTPACWQTV